MMPFTFKKNTLRQNKITVVKLSYLYNVPNIHQIKVVYQLCLTQRKNQKMYGTTHVKVTVKFYMECHSIHDLFFLWPGAQV